MYTLNLHSVICQLWLNKAGGGVRGWGKHKSQFEEACTGQRWDS